MYVMDEDNNNPFIYISDQTPVYGQSGRLDPDRNVPITRRDRVDVNVHYDEASKTFIKDSDSPEFTEESANALNPFEDTALLNGEVKPKVVGIRKGLPKIESKIFIPETEEDEAGSGVKTPVVHEPEQPVYIAEEDAAASTDYIADAMSGVETAGAQTAALPDESVAKLKIYALLLGVVIVLESVGIALMIIL